MSTLTIQLNDGHEISGYVQSEKTHEDSTTLCSVTTFVCVDDRGLMFNVVVEKD